MSNWWSISPSASIEMSGSGSESPSISGSSSESISPSPSSELIKINGLIRESRQNLRKSGVVTIGLYDKMSELENKIEEVAYEY
jgi:hypothetical protein